MEFEVCMTEKVKRIEEIINNYMPQEVSYQKTVIDAMNYTMSAGGKRIRPLLMDETYRLFGGTDDVIKPFMAAIEMIHTYSLIHDDLPALDNDEYRRGRKTAHIVYGEAMAILAGDSLLNYAYETAAKAFDMSSDLTCVAKALQVLAKNPGIYGMIGGQVADVELTGKELNKEELEYIYVNKTGALIEASMMIGAILAGASEERIEMIQKVAYNVGMAFQIQDDILDQTATFEELGKPIHSDEKNAKNTYVAVYGMERAVEEVKRLSEEAIACLHSVDGDSEFLISLVEYLIHRKK